ncbi:hypothetical protein A5742_01955 [Mycolicibacterium fortuitum]|uniref:ESX-1 secretion-associated protein EspA/EspE-like domain-containing protein n=1 Tax=Mycolicibacterium fortuitum TaxID=1766 RepID=A0ABD6QRV2_MYCFO|nr:EspA/EspE family type VII secretion system effector [Mycolicibacterium fortuitum]OMC50487.1 hypothetical protein A5742_01955 [Mycolicibacterium fortuitum]
MGALDAFYTTWSQARTTFGEGAPTTGDSFDGSARLREMQSTMESAAPDERWQGTAAQAYAAKNAEHAAVYGKLADLDQRMAAEVSRAAGVVNAGRQNLEQIQSWVTSMDASIPPGQSAETMRMILARRGLGQVSDTVQRSTEEMGAIGGRVDDIRREYDEVAGETKKAAGWKENPPPVTDEDDRTHDEKVADWLLKWKDLQAEVQDLWRTRPPDGTPDGPIVEAWRERRRELMKKQGELAQEAAELGIEIGGTPPPTAQTPTPGPGTSNIAPAGLPTTPRPGPTSVQGLRLP